MRLGAVGVRKEAPCSIGKEHVPFGVSDQRHPPFDLDHAIWALSRASSPEAGVVKH